MTRLLISVRSVAEADIALAGGADVIDIKEPARGSLGRAPDSIIEAIQERVAGLRPVSAALGELLDDPAPSANFSGLVKVGLAGCACLRDWDHRLALLQLRLTTPLVAVAYADWVRAKAPSPEVILHAAIKLRCPGLLIDTWLKDGSTLLDWIALDQLHHLRELAARHGLFLALAGSLKLEQIPLLMPLGADLLAFRAAACRRGDRGAKLDRSAVQELAQALHRSSTKFRNRTSLPAATFGNHASTNPSAAQFAQSFTVAP